jgi:hypothetical protein
MIKKFQGGASLADLQAVYRYDADTGLFYLKEEFF